MRVLITGGTGIIGAGTVDVLLRRGHQVRVVARNASDDARRWKNAVEAFDASVTDPQSLSGCADGCDAVLHIAGIVQEAPPESTFDGVNVEGTRNLVHEAERAGVRRFVYVSSLGANRGTSAYHRSKHAGEKLAREFSGEVVIVRPGNVYGAGDEVLSTLLEWVRTSPIVPVIGGGDDAFQPIWAGDMAAALAAALEREDAAGRTLEVAGPDRTTLNELLDRMAALTGRSPMKVPVPAAAAAAGIQAAAVLGVELPVNEAQLRMLLEGNVIPADSVNALTDTLGLVATPLDEGLRKLANAAPEQLPSDGFGPLQMRVFHADASDTGTTAEQLIARLRANFGRLMPNLVQTGIEQGSVTRLYEGATLTLSLPVRGHIQVRVAEVTATDVTLLTLRGHPLAGAVKFAATESGDTLRFEVRVYDRAASITDFALMALGGSVLQGRTWQELIRNTLKECGAEGEVTVVSSSLTLEDEEAERVQRWLQRLVTEGASRAAELPQDATRQNPDRRP